MAAARHQHRHYKTLIVLVLSMTSGTLFLFWVGKLAPAKPLTALRGEVSAVERWDQILVQAQRAEDPEGFHHFKIDEAGRPTKSPAWDAGRHDERGSGAIHILVTCDSPDAQLTPLQGEQLARLIAILRAEHPIGRDRVQVLKTQ